MSAPSSNRHERCRAIFEIAVNLTAEERTHYLGEACGTDLELRAELDRLVAAHERIERAPDALRAAARLESFAAQFAHRLTSDMPDPQLPRDRFPRDIGAYVLLGVLGEGGMGIVYVAEQKHPPRRVALKMIRPSLASASALRRFEVEARTLARLQHPGIAQIYDAGEIELDGERRAYLAMELVDGALLGAFAARADVDDAQRMQVLVALCIAVHHAHQKGVIHRDLKPGNVIVDADGRPRVLDFGVARLVDDPASLTTQDTLAARLVGTLPYMSPEHFAGDAHALDTRSDVYSLGVIAYELLSGRLPHDFTRKSLPEVARVVRDESPPLLGAIDARLRGDVEAIVSKALEKEPERRYASALDLARDLERHLAHEPVVARPPSTTYRLRRFAQRNRAVVVSVAALVLALAAGFATSTAQYLRAEERARRLLQLSDLRRCQQLESRASALWPPYPERAADYERWLADVEALLARRAAHERNLRDLRRSATTGSLRTIDLDKRSGAGFVYAESSDAWHDDQLDAVLAELDSLAHPQTGLARGTARTGDWCIERRLQVARSIDERTVRGPDATRHWNEAIRSIADVRECPRYRGLTIVPQVGLLPLGRDPSSRLWEFVHLASGEPPARRGGDGRWQLLPTTGLIMVLVPDGTFQWGTSIADAQRAREVLDEPTDPIELAVAPFFLSKYEMTQGQWLRLRGANPADVAAGETLGGRIVDLLHPVESITFVETRRALECAGLRLPTDAQWQYAACTDVPVWTEWMRLSPSAFGNFADSCVVELESGTALAGQWDDGYAAHAPVGSYAANPFGLHDVLGNVFEFVLLEDEERDWYRGGSFLNLGALIGIQAYGSMGMKGAYVVGVRPCVQLEDERFPFATSPIGPP